MRLRFYTASGDRFREQSVPDQLHAYEAALAHIPDEPGAYVLAFYWDSTTELSWSMHRVCDAAGEMRTLQYEYGQPPAAPRDERTSREIRNAAREQSVDVGGFELA